MSDVDRQVNFISQMIRQNFFTLLSFFQILWTFLLYSSIFFSFIAIGSFFLFRTTGFCQKQMIAQLEPESKCSIHLVVRRTRGRSKKKLDFIFLLAFSSPAWLMACCSSLSKHHLLRALFIYHRHHFEKQNLRRLSPSGKRQWKKEETKRPRE